MNDREKMLADLWDAHEAMSYGDTGAAGQFVSNHSDTIEALLTEPTLEEVLAELESQEFFHDGLAGDLHDVPDKAHAYRLGWDECIQAARECLRGVKG